MKQGNIAKDMKNTMINWLMYQNELRKKLADIEIALEFLTIQNLNELEKLALGVGRLETIEVLIWLLRKKVNEK